MRRSVAGTIATCEYVPTGAATPAGFLNSAVCCAYAGVVVTCGWICWRRRSFGM
jgi:hypothetical protein